MQSRPCGKSATNFRSNLRAISNHLKRHTPPRDNLRAPEATKTSPSMALASGGYCGLGRGLRADPLELHHAVASRAPDLQARARWHICWELRRRSTPGGRPASQSSFRASSFRSGAAHVSPMCRPCAARALLQVPGAESNTCDQGCPRSARCGLIKSSPRLIDITSMLPHIGRIWPGLAETSFPMHKQTWQRNSLAHQNAPHIRSSRNN